MILRETEAKAKLCQETFAAPAEQRPDGTIIRDSGPWMCHASGCAAWRWYDPNVTGAVDRRGYCGKAGRPVS